MRKSLSIYSTDIKEASTGSCTGLFKVIDEWMADRPGRMDMLFLGKGGRDSKACIQLSATTSDLSVLFLSQAAHVTSTQHGLEAIEFAKQHRNPPSLTSMDGI